MLDSLRDYIYPVGSVYISYSHVDPATLFGGTWVRIQNAFLWAVDSSGSIGLTGGAKTHTLTVDETPAHSHGSVYSQHATSTNKYPWMTAGMGSLAYGPVSAGGGAAHNNMPPYVQVSVWRRTA
jgi:microcystin-dependent protein